jgi:hypothetical protein
MALSYHLGPGNDQDAGPAGTPVRNSLRDEKAWVMRRTCYEAQGLSPKPTRKATGNHAAPGNHLEHFLKWSAGAVAAFRDTSAGVFGTRHLACIGC